MAEFALLCPLFLFLVFLSITFAVIGQAALAVSQLAYTGARYAAVHPELTATQVQSYIKSGVVGSPTITGSGGTHLTVTVLPAASSGQPVSVTVAYDLDSNALVSMMKDAFTSLGLNTTFPTTLSATQIAASE
ncbi:MAG: TadE/TadG family type IV pilus assembly protein [Candidatus Binataceae bacterium]